MLQPQVNTVHQGRKSCSWWRSCSSPSSAPQFQFVSAPFSPQCTLVSPHPLVSHLLLHPIVFATEKKKNRLWSSVMKWLITRACVCACVSSLWLGGAEAQTLGVPGVSAQATADVPPESDWTESIRNHVTEYTQTTALLFFTSRRLSVHPLFKGTFERNEPPRGPLLASCWLSLTFHVTKPLMTLLKGETSGTHLQIKVTKQLASCSQSDVIKFTLSYQRGSRISLKIDQI